MPRHVFKTLTHAAPLLGVLFAFFILMSALPAFAQITKTARIELSDKTSKVLIGKDIYITQDPEDRLTYQVIASRHQNNLRGMRENSNIINLGPAPAPSWLVFSVTNASSTEDWVLHFGDVFDGRLALIRELSVRNFTTGELYTEALQKEGQFGAFGEDLKGSALPVKITKGKTELFLIYIEADGILPNTLAPYFITKERFEKELLNDDIDSTIAKALFFAMAIFFLVIAYMQKRAEYILPAFFFLIHLTQFYFLNTGFFATHVFSAEIISLLYVLTILTSLTMTRVFLRITDENHTENMVIFALAALLIMSFIFNVFLFDGNSLINDLLIFIPSTLTLLALCIISFTLGQRGRYGAHYYASAWAMLLIGSLITALSATKILHNSIFTLNAYWFSLIPFSLFLINATTKKIELMTEEERSLQARENRAAQSLARLKQSKESADQARLLRVIERERELMAELREREIQRTEEMRRAKELADEANSAKSAFLAMVSHEIRTPMTGIMGIVRLFMDTKLNNEQSDFILAIQKSGDTMMALLNDILDFEKIETNSMELEEIPFDLLKLAQDVVTLMSAHAADKGLSLSIDVSENFPRNLIGDPTRLRQVLLNLVSNALKFTEQGAVIIRLRATPLEDKDSKIKGDYEIYLAVEDSGIGISEEAQKRLFDPFAQADKDITRKYGGTGLGLAICQRLIKAMGGHIRISSEEQTGSTFFFSLLMQDSGKKYLKDTDLTKMLPSKISIPPMNVLIIEDNEINRKVLQSFLKKAGHTPTLCASGEEALEVFQGSIFDAVFTDIGLTGMSGLETTRIIRTLPDKKKATTPIIAITGNFSDTDIKEYYAAGINGYISKPIDYDVLLNTLSNIHKGELDNPVNLHTLPLVPEPEPIKTPKEQSPAEVTKVSKVQKNPEEPIENEKSEKNQAQSPPIPPEQIDKDQKKDPQLLSMENTLSFDSEYDEQIEAQIQEESGKDMQEHLPPFDTTMMQNLLDTLGKDPVAELINGCLLKAGEIIDEIKHAGEEAQAEFLRDKSHELKGMAANFGLIELSKIAELVEDAAHEGDADTALKESKRLFDANRRAQKAIEEWLS